MIGAIIGDIVGSRFEFNNTNKTDFELFTEECSYTDDTICTIAIADAILKGISYRESLLAWCRKYPHPMGGYGASFARWIASPNPHPYNSWGNGSAMRVSPIGWAFDTIEETLKEAEKTAIITHNHPEGVRGAKCIANFIYNCLHPETRGYSFDSLMSDHGYWYNPIKYIRENNYFDESCQVTVPQALACVCEAKSFEDAIRLAVSIGGDSDTIAAIAGSVAEVRFGIPSEIKEKAISYLPTEMVEIINQFIGKYENRIAKQL